MKIRKEDCFYLGRIIKKYSFKGEVIIKLDTDEAAESYTNLESVFIALGKGLIPFCIEKIRVYKGSGLRVKFKNVEGEAQADSLIKTGVYLPLSLLPPLTGRSFYYHEIIGFSITDTKKGLIGNIKSIDARTSQALFEVQGLGKNLILIPIVDDFIVHIDRKSKNITVKTPEGLLDLYR